MKQLRNYDVNNFCLH